MSSFTAAAPLVPVPGKHRKPWRWGPFRLQGRQVYRNEGPPILFYLGNGDDRRWIEIPTGFETDGASIPVLALWILDVVSFLLAVVTLGLWRINLHQLVMGLLSKAASVHDCMRESSRWNLIECDCGFLIAMRCDKTPKLLREVAFNAVRLNKSRERMV